MLKLFPVLVVLAAFACGGYAVAAPKAKDASPEVLNDDFARGQAAMKAGEYAVAREHFLRFLKDKKSADDSRLGTAKELLPDTWMRQAEALVKANQEPQAATVLLECIAHYKDGPYADRARERAINVLRDGYAAARKTKDLDRAVACADLYVEHFPDPPLAPESELRDLRADWLADSVKMRIDPAVLYERLEKCMKAGVTADDLRKRQVTVHQIRQAFVRSLFEDGYYDKAADLLKKWETEEPAPPAKIDLPPPPPPPAPAPEKRETPAKPEPVVTAPPPTTKPDAARAAKEKAERKELTTLLTKTLIQRAEALLVLGNRPMLQEVLEEMESHAPTASDRLGKSLIQRIHATLEGKSSKSGKSATPPPPPAPPRVLAFKNPLGGDNTWTDDGNGNTIEGKVTVTGNLKVEAGFVLDGGEIFLDKGALNLAGTADRPVIFRNVQIYQELGGSMKATFALFENCKFGKGGWVYDHYSSKWTFNDCLFLKSNFNGLTGVDYGVQIKGCGFFLCKIPPRYLCDAGDAKAIYNDAWNAVEENGFDFCEIAPSFVWTTKRCTFTGCTIRGGVETFRSSTPLDVLMAVPYGSQDFMRQLKIDTPHEGPGAVTYVNAAAKGPVKHRKMPAWRFARSNK